MTDFRIASQRMNDWQKRSEMLQSLPVGSMIQAEGCMGYFFKPTQEHNAACGCRHTTGGMWVSLSNGNLYHFSQLAEYGEITVLKGWTVSEP